MSLLTKKPMIWTLLCSFLTVERGMHGINHPEMKILLLGIFPCRPKPEDQIRRKVKDTNAIISKLHDAKYFFYTDIGAVFLEEDSSISKKILRDYLPLSEKGYERWAEAMQPRLELFLELSAEHHISHAP